MADNDDYESDPNDNSADLVPRAHIRQLEEKARKADELQAQLEAAHRESAFAKALGVAASDPKFGYFVKGYEGELTAEAIRAEAINIGLLTTPEGATTVVPQGRPNLTPGELAAHARMATASEGAGTNRPVDLMEAFGPRGSKTPEEILSMAEAAGRVTSRTYE